MLPIEKEMIGLLMKGASTPLDNIRVSVFLAVWSAAVLAIARMAQYAKETKASKEGDCPESQTANGK